MPDTHGPEMQGPTAPKPLPPPPPRSEPGPARHEAAAPTTPLERPGEHFVTAQERNWSMACHLSSLLGYVSFFGFILGPLIVWLVKRDESPLVDDQGKESLNFQLSMLVYYVASALLVLVLIGIPLLVALFVFQLVEIIIASVRAKHGELYRYPLTIRFVS